MNWSPFELAPRTTAFIATERRLQTFLFDEYPGLQDFPDEFPCNFRIYAFVWAVPSNNVGMLLATSVFTSHN